MRNLCLKMSTWDAHVIRMTKWMISNLIFTWQRKLFFFDIVDKERRLVTITLTHSPVHYFSFFTCFKDIFTLWMNFMNYNTYANKLLTLFSLPINFNNIINCNKPTNYNTKNIIRFDHSYEISHSTITNNHKRVFVL